ncbi:hypothetical protein HY251_21495, partial [bacterium]|nr:hypothetical protein [bacterium]
LLARLASPLPWVVAVLVAAPWFLLASRVEPGFLEAFFLGENWKRFAARSVEHTHGPFFFLGVLAWGLGPWLLAGIALVLARIRSPREKNDDASEPRGRGFLLGFAALTVIFFSLSSTKVETYLLPAFPALAAVIAGETARALEGGDDRERRALAVAFGAVAACFVLASLAGLLVGLHAFELTAARWKAFQEETVPWLALLPLPFVFLACLHARARKPLRAVLVLALALLSAFPFAIGPARAATRLRSCEPIALLIQEARSERAPGARVASFHYYYRGLPFYLDEPVVLLGEKGELHDDAFLDRPDLYFDDTRIVTFMRGSRPVLVAMPNEKERPARFLQFFEQAGAVPTLVGVVDDDVLFLVP